MVESLTDKFKEEEERVRDKIFNYAQYVQERGKMCSEIPIVKERKIVLFIIMI